MHTVQVCMSQNGKEYSQKGLGGLLSLKSGKFVSGEKYTAPPPPTPVYTPEFSKHINRLYELAYDYRLMRIRNIESLDLISCTQHIKAQGILYSGRRCFFRNTNLQVYKFKLS